MDRITWLVLGYQVPVTPSKKRVYVWRKLKEMGAIYFRQGVAMLPKSAANYQRFQILSNKIGDMNGEATLAELRYVNKEDEIKAISEFRHQSQLEYQKIIKEILALQREIEKNPELAHESEDKIRRLGKKLSQVKARDYFMSIKQPEVTSNFERLLQDMSTVSFQLREHILGIITER